MMRFTLGFLLGCGAVLALAQAAREAARTERLGRGRRHDDFDIYE